MCQRVPLHLKCRSARRIPDIVVTDGGYSGWSQSASGLARCPCSALDLVSVALPPRLISRWHIGSALSQPNGAVNELAHDVGMAGVAVRLRNHVYEHAVERRVAALGRPPRHHRAEVSHLGE